MSLHLSPTCLAHLSPTLVSLGRMSLHLSPPCLALWVPCGRHEFTLMRPTLEPRVGDKLCETTLGSLGRHEFTLMSAPCLPLWVPSVGRHEGDKCKLIRHLSPTLGSLGCMSLQACKLLLVSYTCLSHLSSTLVSHSGCLGLHEFTLVSPLSPILGALGRMILQLSPPCLPHLSLTLGALGRMSLHLSPHLSPTLDFLGRMSLHLSPPCLPLWVPWAA